MWYSTASKTISLFTAVSLAGCASMNTYNRVDAEPVARSANYKGEVPAGVVEDAMRLDGSAPLFDDAIYKKIESAVKSGHDLQTVQKNIRDVICDGSTARVQPKLTVHLVLSKPPKGEPLDAVAEHNRVFISETKTYLKSFWLDSGSRTDLMGKSYNSDFEMYERNMVQTGMERRSASSLISVGVPFMPGASAKGTEAYFANARAMPTLRPIEETGPIDWSPSRSYLSVSFPKEHYVVLSNKVTDMVLAVWGFNGYGTEMKSSVVRNVQFTPETTFQYFGISDGVMFRNSAQYMETGNTWKLKDGTVVRPLMKAVIDDLQVLKSSFSWRIPKSDLQRLFHVTDADDLQHFGYDENGKYSAALALDNQQTLWSRMLEIETEVSQASREDGSVIYRVVPSFDAFCHWAVPTSSLKGE